MTSASNRVIEIPEEYTEDSLRSLVVTCEQNSRQIEKPKTPKDAKNLTKVVHSILSGRLIAARNKSSLNNDKINRAMVDAYMERGREGKAWTFTNATNSRTAYFPDGEEVSMLAKLLKYDEGLFSIHLAVTPWIMKDRRARREERRKKEDLLKQKKAGIADVVETQNNNATTSEEVSNHPGQPLKRIKEPATQQPKYHSPVFQKDQRVGDLKITHHGNHIQINGKIWCDKKTAQQLRMIVQVKLIKQASHDDPWCYELYGPVHNYQLYSLIHVLYGAPKVLSVQHD